MLGECGYIVIKLFLVGKGCIRDDDEIGFDVVCNIGIFVFFKFCVEWRFREG